LEQKDKINLFSYSIRNVFFHCMEASQKDQNNIRQGHNDLEAVQQVLRPRILTVCVLLMEVRTNWVPPVLDRWSWQ